MKKLNLTPQQKSFLLGAIERESQNVYDDPEVYGIEDEDFETIEEYDKAVNEFVSHVGRELIEIIEKSFTD